MNPRSLRFRLIIWYAGVVTFVVFCFAVFTHRSLDLFMQQVVADTVSHRARQIAETLLHEVQARGETYLKEQIDIRYAPQINDRFIRITRADGTIAYLSGVPADQSFDPSAIPAAPVPISSKYRQEAIANGNHLLIVALPHQIEREKYLVEVGASLAASQRVARALDLSLGAGLSVVVCLVILGGHILMKRALRPVENLMGAAQEITLHNLSRRLPIRHSNDEIEGLARVLNQMIARLDESFQHTSRFTADASHELRTPLTIMRGELEALLFRDNLSEDMRAAVASLLEEVERLVRIVEGLFALTRLDAGEAQARSVRLDLAKLAENTAEQMCLLAEEKQIALTCDTKAAVEVHGDPARLKQVVVNLLDNAIKYTPSGGTVTLSVLAKNGQAVLEVKDTGAGIPEKVLPHIFERFFRSDEVRSREIGGAGLGLSIVHSICAAHGGCVVACNLDPAGSQFTVTLPRATSSTPSLS